MAVLAYLLLKGTGRRVGEIASLHLDCLDIDEHGKPVLVYDNHKAGRMRRRLPITTGTAQIIMGWEERRTGLATPPAQRSWLFPSPLLPLPLDVSVTYGRQRGIFRNTIIEEARLRERPARLLSCGTGKYP